METIAKIRLDHLVRGVPIKKIARGFEGFEEHGAQGGAGRRDLVQLRAQDPADAEAWAVGGGNSSGQLKANEKKARKDRLSLLRIHEDLGALGYGGGYDAVRRYAKDLAAAGGGCCRSRRPLCR